MSWKVYLKPSWQRLAFSAGLTLLFLLFTGFTAGVVFCDCIPRLKPLTCTDYTQYMLFPQSVCHCGCISLEFVLMQYLQLIVGPFLISYLAYPLIFPKRKK